MPALDSTQNVPLLISDDGTIRIAGARVTLDSVLHHYRQGATADEIALRFPALRLADIHSCLAYYLNHQEKIEEYLSQRHRQAEELQTRISSDPEQKERIAGLRERLQKRLAEKQARAA